MYKFWLFLLVLVSFNVNSSELPEYKAELIMLGEADQEVREGNINWSAAEKVDTDNLRKLKFLIKKNGFPTLEKVGKEAYIYAFLIAQHSVSDVEFMRYYMAELNKRLGTGAIVDRTFAYLLDRTNELAGEKQVYGTQGHCIKGEYEISPVKNRDNLESLRKKIGLLSLKEFSKKACIDKNG